MKLLGLICISVVLVLNSKQVNGHGNMVWPLAWWDKHEDGWFWDEGKENHIGCGVLGLPDDTEFTQKNNKQPDCLKYWFSHGVEIPGHATIPDEAAQNEITCVGQAGHHDTHKKFPWNAPGTAPVYGPCGANGGKPFGCNDDGKGHFGDCCGDHCDHFALGDNAENYHWHHAPATEWKAGSEQEVAWYVGANHAGGYSYRLCKLPAEGIKGLTEECFQEMPLDFVGEDQWVNYFKDRKTGHRTKQKATQTTEGTFPEGSMWRTNPIIPHMEPICELESGRGHIIDNVMVPEDLEPGDYVLSFRWDCKCSPQIWGACANIKIV